MKRPSLPTFPLQPRSYKDNEFMWLDSSTTADQVLDRIATMRCLERTSYARRDYLYSHDSPYYYHHHHHHHHRDATSTTSSSSSNDSDNDSTLLWMDALYVLGPLPLGPSPASTPTGSKKRPLSSSSSSWHSHHQQQHQQHKTSIYHPYINEKTRQYMVDLLYEIADYCHFRRETVSFAVWNLLDRYLSCESHAPLKTYADLQLLALACLLVAVKCLEPVSMDVVSLADLSKGNFTAHDILAMEQTILVQLHWKVAHGPTPIAYCQHYLTLLHLDGVLLQTMSSSLSSSSSSANDTTKMDCATDNDNDDSDNNTHWDLLDSLLEQAQYQVELAASQYHLVTQRQASEIALAAVWNALEAQLDTATAQSLEEHLKQRLALAGFVADMDSTTTRMIAKIQLTLCKLQYNAQAAAHVVVPTTLQQPQPQLPPIPHVQSMEERCETATTTTTTTSTSSSVDSTTLCNTSCCSHPGNDNDKDEQEEEEATERDDNDSFQEHFSLLYPSPISVMTNPVLSANTNTSTNTSTATQTNKSDSNNSNNNHTKETHTEATGTYSAYDTYYDLSFLKRLFFS